MHSKHGRNSTDANPDDVEWIIYFVRMYTQNFKTVVNLTSKLHAIAMFGCII